jgi:hypothetical protein
VLELLGRLEGIESTADLTTENLARFVRWRSAEVCPNTVRSELAYLSAACSFAAEEGWLEHPPRFKRIRPVLQGEPIVLVENGQLIKRNMDRERLSLDDLAEQARLNDIASVDDVRWAILETNGQISFIKQQPSQA